VSYVSAKSISGIPCIINAVLEIGYIKVDVSNCLNNKSYKIELRPHMGTFHSKELQEEMERLYFLVAFGDE
jgi:hypothetical protein